MVRWEPPLEGACPVVRYNVYYREVISAVDKRTWKSVIVDRNATSYILRLGCKREYEIGVTSLNGHRESALNDSRIWNFKTGGGNTTLVC